MNRTFNASLINLYIADDPAFCKIKNPHEYPDIYFLYEPGVGVFPSVKRGDVMSVHACIRPSRRGKRAVQAAKDCISWIWENTDVKKVRTRAHRDKRHLLIFNALILDRCGEDDTYVYYEVSRG